MFQIVPALTHLWDGEYPFRVSACCISTTARERESVNVPLGVPVCIRAGKKLTGCGGPPFEIVAAMVQIARSYRAVVSRQMLPQTRSFTQCCQRANSSGRNISGRGKIFRVSEEVQDAVATGKPVVALETTIYTHGWSAMSLLVT